MIERIEGIVLDVRRHNDSHDVVTLYTRSRGGMVFVSSSGNTAAGRKRRARLQPLSHIEASINIIAGKDLQTLRGFDVVDITPNMYYNPIKRSIAIFLAEFLYKLLRAAPADDSLFRYLTISVKHLDMIQRSVANFHIAVMKGMLGFMGIMPDIDKESAGEVFDMRQGVMVDNYITHSDCIKGEEAKALPKILRITQENQHKYKLSRYQRQRIISLFLKYFNIHFPGSGNLKSPEILSEIF